MRFPFEIGMTPAQARELGASITWDEPDPLSETVGTPGSGRLDRDGWRHEVHFNAVTNVADRVSSTRRGSGLQGGRDLIEAIIELAGAPAIVERKPEHVRPDLRGKNHLEWQWPQKTLSFTHESFEGAWDAEWSVNASHGWRTETTRSIAETRALSKQLATIASNLDGDRGDAMRRWHAAIERRRLRIESFLDLVEITSPTVEIRDLELPDLVAQAGWFARADELFDHDGDCCDAIAMQRYGPFHAGWQSSNAYEGDAPVELVEGPFAAGILRVLHGVSVLPVREVDGVVSDKDTATCGPITVTVHGGYNHERIARALAMARAWQLGLPVRPR